jgi:Domain of unknown function (DUF4158)
MPVRFLSDAQREQLLSGFPAELEPESLDRFFTLSGPDLAEVRRRHGDENRLGWSLQLCGLRMLGFCPDDVTTAPPSAVRFVARQLGVDPWWTCSTSFWPAPNAKARLRRKRALRRSPAGRSIGAGQTSRGQG